MSSVVTVFTAHNFIKVKLILHGIIIAQGLSLRKRASVLQVESLRTSSRYSAEQGQICCFGLNLVPRGELKLDANIGLKPDAGFQGQN